MDKILSDKSPLHFLPLELETGQLMILDSLRFTLEMADYTFKQLVNTLEATSRKSEKNHFKAFNYAWSFIDHCHRFLKLYKVLNSSNESIINEIAYIQKFRNAIQHIDMNLGKSTNIKMIDNGRPIFGALKWVVNNVEKDEIYTSLWISGIFNIKNITFEHHAKEGYENFINDIKLETDTMNKNVENEISLSKTYLDVQMIVKTLDENLETSFNKNKLQWIDWKKRKDVILDMKNE